MENADNKIIKQLNTFRYVGWTDSDDVYPGSNVNTIELNPDPWTETTMTCAKNDVVTKGYHEYVWDGEYWMVYNPDIFNSFKKVEERADNYIKHLIDIGVQPSWVTVKLAYLTGAGVF